MELKKINVADFAKTDDGYVLTEEQLLALDQELVNAEEANAELEDANTKLLAQFEKLSAAPEAKPAKEQDFKTLSFSLDDVKYGFAYPHFSRGGEKITATQIANDVKLQKELVGKNHSILRKI